MKDEVMHEVALMMTRFCRQIERRSLEIQETPDSSQGVEEIYAETVQQYLAMESRLSQNMEQKRKSVETQDVAAGTAGKSRDVLSVVCGVHGVVTDAQRISLVETQLGRQLRPLEVQEVAAEGLRAEIVQRCVEMQSHLPSAARRAARAPARPR